MRENAPGVSRELAEAVVRVLPLDAIIRHAFVNIEDNAPHFSTDGLDYMYAAATVYRDLVDIARTGLGTPAGDEEYIAWLQQPPFENWLATDGDIRWFLSEYISDDNVAINWGNFVENLYEY